MVGVSYIEYENLEEPKASQMDPTALLSLAASEDWKHHYDCLNLLRALNRFNRDYFLSEPVQALSSFVRDQVDSLRSNLGKCALMLVKEVFQAGAESAEADSRLAPFVRQVLPTVILKTVFEKNFIATEAKKACEQCVVGGAQALPDTVEAFVEGCKQVKNLALAEQAASGLSVLLKHMPAEFFSVPSESLKNLLSQAISEVEGKRAKLKKAALANLNTVRTKTGGSLEQILVETAGIAPDRAQGIVAQVDESLKDGAKKGAADKSRDFRSFLKQQK